MTEGGTMFVVVDVRIPIGSNVVSTVVPPSLAPRIEQRAPDMGR